MASRLWLASIGGVGLLFCLALVYDRWVVGRRVRALLDEHAQALARRRAQLVRIDDYGVEIDKAWRREIGHFFERVILPNLRPVQQRIAVGRRARIEERIDAKARAQPLPSARPARPAAGKGIDFERQCQQILAGRGWSARLTPASGDQGADIIAEKQGMSIVLQCKLYARPVGNKAVQEVAAARTFYDAGFAAVVSNADYTEAARRLARRNEILLLHIDDLHDLDGRLRDPAV
jgi:restriction system protein